ncbi:hypothetical protein ACA910_011603 [Epithemia clementina (nom. ined.)]
MPLWSSSSSTTTNEEQPLLLLPTTAQGGGKGKSERQYHSSHPYYYYEGGGDNSSTCEAATTAAAAAAEAFTRNATRSASPGHHNNDHHGSDHWQQQANNHQNSSNQASHHETHDSNYYYYNDYYNQNNTRTTTSTSTRPLEGILETVQEVALDVKDAVVDAAMNVKDAVVDVAWEAKDAVVEEMRQVQDSLVQELQAADQEEDKYLFLDMGLARNLSILPGDVVDAAALQHDHHDQAISQSCSLFPNSLVVASVSGGGGGGGGTPFVSSLPEQQQRQRQRQQRVIESYNNVVNVTTEAVNQDDDGNHHDYRDYHDYHDHDGNNEARGERKQLVFQSMSSSSSSRASSGEAAEDDTVRNNSPGKLAHAVCAVPMTAYVLLLSAVVSLSSIGPLLEIQNGVDPTMKVCWRTTATWVILLPLAWQAVRTEGVPHLSWSHWVMVQFTAMAYTVLCVFFVLALDYTSVGNALILSNSQSIMLLIGKFFVGQRVTPLEAAGALVAFGGAILCSKDSSEAVPEQHDNNASSSSSPQSTYSAASLTYLGDFYALVSAIGGVGYLVFAKSVRLHLNLYVFMFLNMFLSSLYSLAILYTTGAPISLGLDRDHGIFGWLNVSYDRLPLELVMVLVCNLFGAMGYVRAMQFFDSLVISVAALMEPVVAELVACLLGVGFLPGWKGWLGNALVTSGTFAVVYTPDSHCHHHHNHKQQHHNHHSNGNGGDPSNVYKPKETDNEDESTATEGAGDDLNS